MTWLKLIRWNNLIIIFLTQYFVWAYVIVPERYAFPDLGLLLNYRNFLCLSFSTLFIAAAGFIINDYFDIKNDAINHPEKVVLGKKIPRKNAILLHAFLNISALLLSTYVAAQAHHYEWILIQLFCISCLWYYSTHFKRQYILGNIVISFLTAITILVLPLYEPVMMREATLPIFSTLKGSGQTSLPVWVIGVYAYFAFFLTWMREIVKDIADHKTDEEEGWVTMPVKRGIRFSMQYTITLGIIVMIPLALASVTLFRYDYELLSAYIAIFLMVPMLVWSYFFMHSNTVKQYQNTSTWLKWIMFLGIFSLMVYHIQLLIRFGK